MLPFISENPAIFQNLIISFISCAFLFDIALPISMSVSFTVQYVRGERAVNATENSLAKPYTNSITASIYVRTYTLGHFPPISTSSVSNYFSQHKVAVI